KVWREEANFDLLVQYCRNAEPDKPRFVVIENKFKSMPRGEQLDEYRGKVRDGTVAVELPDDDGSRKPAKVKPSLDNTSFFLLAPQKSIGCTFPELPEGWASVSYESLLAAFPAAVQGDAFASGFVSEYKQMMGDMLTVLNHAVTAASDENAPCIADKDMLLVLEKIRVHDIYQKLFFSAMQQTLGIQRTGWRCESFYRHGGNIKLTYDKGGMKYGIELQNNDSKSMDFHVFAESEQKLPDDESALRAQLTGWICAAFTESDITQKKDGTLNGYYGTHKYVHAKVPAATSIAALRSKITAVMAAIEK
ncbi:MAG: hypothetical protein II187_10630, partial [Treponema sp.]|nr:hypothetical protein [Treponema sp.]